jgi:hypothetical protein
VFWRTTPAQLSAISDVHFDLNTPDTGPKVAMTVEEAGIAI